MIETEFLMQIRELFTKQLDRPINGVVKAEQLDEQIIWTELDEYVVTRELDRHLRHFLRPTCLVSAIQMILMWRVKLGFGYRVISVPVNLTL